MNTQTSLLNMISDCHLLSIHFTRHEPEANESRAAPSLRDPVFSPDVRGFPRFVSAVHSQCESDEARK